MLKSRFSALLSLLLVFLSGVLVGGFTYRFYNVSVAAAPNSGRKLDPEEARKHIVADMRARLKLDSHQVDQLQQIFDNTRDQFRQIHDKMNAEGQAIHNGQIEKVKAILRADQVPLNAQTAQARRKEVKKAASSQRSSAAPVWLKADSFLTTPSAVAVPVPSCRRASPCTSSRTDRCGPRCPSASGGR